VQSQWAEMGISRRRPSNPDAGAVREGKPIPQRKLFDSCHHSVKRHGQSSFSCTKAAADRTQTRSGSASGSSTALRAAGRYQFVSVDSVGKNTRGQMMPAIAPEERFERRAPDGYFHTLSMRSRSSRHHFYSRHSSVRERIRI